MQAASVAASSVGITQASLGLAVFDQNIFSAANGFVTIQTSTSVTTGVAPSKMQWVPAGGGILGSSNLGAVNAATYMSSSTVRAFLGVIDAAAGGTFNGDLNVNNIFANANNTYDLGATATRFRAIYGVTGSFSGNVTDNGNRVITSVDWSSGNGISITSETTTGPSAAATINNTGILSVTGTANQVSITAGQNPTFSLPQSIATSSDVQFNKASLKYLTGVDAGSGWAIVQNTWKLDTGASFQATYADLAERYSSDKQYEPGTVLVFGGEHEVTISTNPDDRKVAGVVSTNPAYNMNVDCPNGIDVALQGRVPCKVVGFIRKGDMMTTSHIPGVATSNDNPTTGSIIGKALENYDSTEVGIIEVAVGRL
jgi:hypothetical protein